MPLFRRATRPAPSPEDHRRIRSELAKLDPWSFWSVELEDPDVDYAVIGATGAFAVAIVALEGYVEPEGDRVLVEGVEVAGFRSIARGARRLHGRLLTASAFAHVDPILCLTRAKAGSSKTVRGIRLVRLEDLAAEIANRDRTLDPTTARRAAGSLGRVLPSSSGSVDRED